MCKILWKNNFRSQKLDTVNYFFTSLNQGCLDNARISLFVAIADVTEDSFGTTNGRYLDGSVAIDHGSLHNVSLWLLLWRRFLFGGGPIGNDKPALWRHPLRRCSMTHKVKMKKTPTFRYFLKFHETHG